ncbi:hypothetical protein KABACHOK_00780 [Brevundimonas phage vB_BpoS-Kabachok]|uniref:Uncharacterized protein n=2 Tax=Marchewkavirus TaxID=3425052 RepID=A0A9E7SJX5_9CAUD|nr:hypothetical protein KABACHOK_00780 [Brevundimonas phage vB_BpoS-Kabachok]USN14611.1 hypothetical protein DOMOVOI_01370 [Brevundimonas phage vB_BpoS-Domovoi]
MTWNDIAGAYIGVGLVLALLSWFRVHMMDLKDQFLCLLAVTFLWLPLILAAVVFFCLFAFSPTFRRRSKVGRRGEPEWKARRRMNALKDKHGIDDEAVMTDIIARIKARRPHA